jgi:hypothetical protein
MKKLDPCIGVGFIIRNHNDFVELTQSLEFLKESPNSIFGIQDVKIMPKNDDIDWHKIVPGNLQ